mmetsp:Transcript_1509/g.4280  ORF Transcript_1509/g.4280 Transcript_1509/m.4280 type:complete len:253 (-) Transcript_1509:81-839(-)
MSDARPPRSVSPAATAREQKRTSAMAASTQGRPNTSCSHPMSMCGSAGDSSSWCTGDGSARAAVVPQQVLSMKSLMRGEARLVRVRLSRVPRTPLRSSTPSQSSAGGGSPCLASIAGLCSSVIATCPPDEYPPNTSGGCVQDGCREGSNANLGPGAGAAWTSVARLARTHLSAVHTSSTMSACVAAPCAARCHTRDSEMTTGRAHHRMSEAAANTYHGGGGGKAPRCRMHTHTLPTLATVRGPDEFHHDVPR